MTLQQKEIIT